MQSRGQSVRLALKGPHIAHIQRPEELAAACQRKLGFEACPDWAGSVVSSQELSFPSS